MYPHVSPFSFLCAHVLATCVRMGNCMSVWYDVLVKEQGVTTVASRAAALMTIEEATKRSWRKATSL